jgi:agarase
MRLFAALVAALAVLTAGCIPTSGPRRLHLDATGYFRTAYVGGRWWLVTPDGHPFYSRGVDHVSADPDTDRTTGQCPYCETIAAKYPSVDAWATTQVQRLRSWGFNTVSSWSDLDQFSSRMPYTDLLSMASGNDWFSPDFETHAQEVAATDVAPRRDDPNLIGWVTDSELHWSPDWRSGNTLLTDYLALPAGAPGRAVAEQYVDNPSGFELALADRYFSVTTAAIRAVDPNHLILGVKMVAQFTPVEVLEAASQYVDVFTVDDYTWIPGLTDSLQKLWGPFAPVDPTLAAQYAIVKKPIIIAEYSFRAADAGVPNSYPPIYPTYATQQARTDAYAAFVAPLYNASWIVGDEWFEYTDEPAGGRFDGEDSDFGIVSTADNPWSVLLARMTQEHAAAPDRVVDPSPPCYAWRQVGQHHTFCTDHGHS